jgi:hypothetical protein
MAQSSGTSEKGSAGVVSTKPRVASAPPYHRVSVLAIGLNKNPKIGDLKYARRDAEEVAQVFKDIYGFTDVTTLLDEQATRQAVETEIKRIEKGLSAGNVDDVIIFFSGHGATLEEKVPVNGKDEIISHGFLVPYGEEITQNSQLADFQKNAIGMEWLVNEIVAMPARHRILLIDSCFSGLAFKVQPVTVKPPDDVYEKVITKPTVQIMTAGLDSERALDVDADDIKHGLFTYALLKQLREGGVRTVEEVFFPLRAEVRNKVASLNTGTTMTPQLRYLKQESEGTYVFVSEDRRGNWAGQSAASNPDMQAATEKGFYRPVEDDEVQKVKNTPPEQAKADPKWDAQVERYEARASMGDPKAMAVLAEIYGRGVGVKKNPARSSLWATESSHTLSVASLLGISDPATAALVDTFVKVKVGPGPSFGKSGSPASNAPFNKAAADGTASVITTVSGAFKTDGVIGGLFKKKAAGEKWQKKISSQPDDVYKYLNSTKPNFNTALKRVGSWEEELRDSQKDLPQVGSDLVEKLGATLQDMSSQLRQQKSEAAIETLKKARELNEKLGEVYLAHDGAK